MTNLGESQIKINASPIHQTPEKMSTFKLVTPVKALSGGLAVGHRRFESKEIEN